MHKTEVLPIKCGASPAELTGTSASSSYENPGNGRCF